MFDEQLLMQYIHSMRGSGYDDQQIQAALRQAGWNDQQLAGIFSAPATREIVYSKPRTHSKRLLWVGALVAALVLLTGLGAWWWMNRDSAPETASQESTETAEPAASLTPFVDPNFKMSIPKSWRTDAEYQAGGPMVVFYSYETDIGDLVERSATMRVFSAQPKKAGETKDTRIDNQLASIEADGGEVLLVSDEGGEYGGQPGRLIEATITLPETPNRDVRIVSLTVETTDFLYHIDIAALEEHWGLHREAVLASIDSFEPILVEKKN